MDKETLKSNIKAVKEFILDEQKLVTYISLSKELCIHVNDAKLLLTNVIEDIKKSNINIFVGYTISGLFNNNRACTTVCKESDLESLKQTLKVVFYEHVYCVSLGVQDVDKVALTAVNKFEDFPLCTGLIKSNSCSKRSNDEIRTLKSSTNKVITVESKPNNVIKKNSLENPKSVIKNEPVSGNEVVVKSEPRSKTPSPKKVANTNTKTPSPKKDVTSSNKTSVKKNGNKGAVKSIAGFFSKANGNSNKTNNAKVKEEKKDVDVDMKAEKENKLKTEVSTVENTKPIKTEKDEPATKVKDEPINKSKEKSANKSLKQIKKNSKVDKKRKRVLHVSDSESDVEGNDPFADDDKMAVDPDSEDEIPPTPLANTVKITSGIVNPKKRRKIVDKTYTDEDGYILTKKEEVYESCSDNDEEAKPIENSKQEKENIKQVIQIKTETSPKQNGKGKKKVSPPQKGKQQMLTNFFKKV